MRASVLIFCTVIFNFSQSCGPLMKNADLIVHHAKIYTIDGEFSIAGSFAVLDGKFIAVGSDRDILDHYTASQVIDAHGKTVYPGFIDAHSHFYGYGIDLEQYADLTSCRSFGEVLGKLRKFSDRHDNSWILGRGWDQNTWENMDFPDNTELNSLFPSKPVMLIRIDGHAVLVNDAALKIAGINSSSVINGGEILKKNGHITGVLIDNAADLIRSKIPEPSSAVKINAMVNAQANCFSKGLTTVCDAGMDKRNIELVDSLQKAGKLMIRLYAMISPTDENISAYLMKGIYKTDRLNVRSVKLYADGALGSRGAKLILPYSDQPDQNGLMVEKPEYYGKMCRLAYDHGYQVNTHAIGDSANRFILNIYSHYLKGKNDLRWRIEHAQVVDPSDINKFGTYSIIPSVQATHATSDMKWAINRLGAVRIKNAYAYHDLMKQNGWIANGTDFPVEQIDPVFTFYAAVSRKNINGEPSGGFQIENALSRRDALRSITIWAAKAAFEENEKGSIETGKWADFVITDKDLLQCPENEIPAIQIMATYLSGKLVYSKEN